METMVSESPSIREKIARSISVGSCKIPACLLAGWRAREASVTISQNWQLVQDDEQDY